MISIVNSVNLDQRAPTGGHLIWVFTVFEGQTVFILIRGLLQEAI